MKGTVDTVEKGLIRWISVVCAGAGLALAGCGGAGNPAILSIKLTATPVISLAGGTYGGPQTVTITDATPGAVIYYTAANNVPAAIYSGPITVAISETLAAEALAPGYAYSAGTTATYVIEAPIANAGGPYSGIEGVAVNFNGSASSSPAGTTLTYAWNFGDGATGTGVSPAHTYTAWGTYTAALTVTDSNNVTNTATAQVIVPNGRAFANQKPLVGAHVYLLAANTTGYGGLGLAASSSNASVSLLHASGTGQSDSLGAYTLTGADGSFFIAGNYSCTPGSQVYLYALGGTNAQGTNTATGLLAALGACPRGGTFAATPYVAMNEVSTIATAYAIAGFATDATHVSSSGTALAQVGIANAFANATNLETLGTGVALATTPAGNGTVPQTEINSLANILADCTGTLGASSNGCTLLFGYAPGGGVTSLAPTDTATAAINIAHNPGRNVAGLFALSQAAPAFTPVFAGQIVDFTVAVAFNGGGLGDFFGLGIPIAIDGAGNAWIVNKTGNSVTGISSKGTFLSGANGFTGSGLGMPGGVAIDLSGNAWIANQSSNSVTEISSVGALVSGSSGYTGGGMLSPTGIAIDGSGAVWVTNYTGNSVTKLSPSGSVLSGTSGYAGAGFVVRAGWRIDNTGSAWITNNTPSSVVRLSNSGSVLS